MRATRTYYSRMCSLIRQSVVYNVHHEHIILECVLLLDRVLFTTYRWTHHRKRACHHARNMDTVRSQYVQHVPTRRSFSVFFSFSFSLCSLICHHARNMNKKKKKNRKRKRIGKEICHRTRSMNTLWTVCNSLQTVYHPEMYSTTQRDADTWTHLWHAESTCPLTVYHTAMNFTTHSEAQTHARRTHLWHTESTCPGIAYYTPFASSRVRKLRTPHTNPAYVWRGGEGGWGGGGRRGGGGYGGPEAGAWGHQRMYG